MFGRVYLWGLIVLLAVSGCSSDGDERRQEYLDADYYTRLELPPDLTAPEESKQLVSPQPSAEAMEQFEKDSAEVGKFESNIAPIVVGIKVEGARIQSNDGVFWLEVDETAETLWPQLIGFWSNEGIDVVRKEPLLGFMQTDWSSQLHVEEDAGFFKSMFSKLESSKLDKFRMRVEPHGVDKTRIFISHTGRELIVEGEDSNWHSRCSEAGLEREMLTRLSLYVGMDKSQAAEALAHYRPYSSRVQISQDDVNTLYITGTMDVVWERSLRAFDRMDVAILEQDENQNQMKVAIGEIKDEQLDVEEDEIAKSSWLMQWFKGSPSEDYKSESARQFIIKLARNDGVVRLDILEPNNEPAETVLAEQFRKTLAQELR
jgi:outer membrane protein assembly factor BamC